MLKRLPLLLSVFMLLTTMLHAQSRDCAKFRTGTFKMTYAGKTAIITRDAFIQTEQIDISHITATYNIKWFDNCTYTLTPTVTTLSKFPNMAEELIITVQIDKVNKNNCVVTTTSNLYNKVLKGEMEKIN
jgi:hypothetical protein